MPRGKKELAEQIIRKPPSAAPTQAGTGVHLVRQSLTLKN